MCTLNITVVKDTVEEMLIKSLWALQYSARHACPLKALDTIWLLLKIFVSIKTYLATSNGDVDILK